jgi:hypothetical protein
LVPAARAAATPPVREPILTAHQPAKIDVIRAPGHLVGQHQTRATFGGDQPPALYRVLRNESAERRIRRGDNYHLPSQPTLSRLLETLSQPANLQVLREAVGELAGRRLRAMRRGHRQREVSLDIDGLPIEVHGNQPGSAWNGHYHQRMYHPLVASVAETGDLLDARLRAGDRAREIPCWLSTATFWISSILLSVSTCSLQ